MKSLSATVAGLLQEIGGALSMNREDRKYREIWALDRVLSRVLAAWSWVAVWLLLTGRDYEKLEMGQAFSLLTVGLLTLAGFIVLTWVSILCHPYHTDSWFLLGGATVCVWTWLLDPPDGENKHLFWLAVTLIYTLFVWWGITVNRKTIDRIKLGKKTAWIIGITAAAVSCAVISVITCLRYKTFSSPNYDFGLFVNMFHNMKETGLPMITSERDRLLSHFAVHISPVYYLLLPFYFLFPSPMTLQIGQAVALMLGVIPVILLCRHYKLSGRATVVLSLLYCFYPALSSGCFYDIHENCFLPLFLLLTFYFFESDRPIPMFLSALGVLSVKEDAAVYLLIFALYVILARKKYWRGIGLGVLAGGYFALTAYLLNKYGLGMMVNRFDNLIYDKDMGLLGVIKTALVNPGFVLTQMFSTSTGGWEKLVYFCQLLLPLGMLPFVTKKASRWLLLAPVLMNLITLYQYQYNLGFQYHFGIAAFLIYATVQNLPTLSKGWRRSLLGFAVASCLCLYVVTVLPVLSNYTDRWQSGKDTYVRMEEILDTVPEDASVNCSTFLLAHIADRDVIYEIGYHKNKPDIDYVVIDARYSDWQQKANAYLVQGYELHFSEPGKLVILKKPVSP